MTTEPVQIMMHPPNQLELRDAAELAPAPWRILFCICSVALAIRLVAALLFVFHSPEKWRNDGLDHWTYAYEVGRVARSLASGHGFSDPLKVPTGPSAWLPPVYPLIFAAVFKMFGIYSVASAFAIRVFDCVVSALTCIPVFMIGRRFSQATGLWAAWAWAIFPQALLSAAAIVWDSSLSAPILCCLLWLTIELETRRSTWAWAAYGALWGLGGLTNPTMLAAFPLLLGWLGFKHRPSRTWLLRSALTILASLTVMAPWVIRNYLVFHQPFLLKSNLWLEFMVGNGVNQWSFNITDAHPNNNPAVMRRFLELGEAGFMAEKKHEAIGYLQSYPALYLWLCVRRFVYVWTGFWSFSRQFLSSGTDGGLRHIALTCAYTIPLLLGLRRGFRLNRDIALLLVIPVAAVPFVTYLTHPYGYYRYIVDPEVVVLAVYGLLPLLSFLAHRSSASPEPSTLQPVTSPGSSP